MSVKLSKKQQGLLQKALSGESFELMQEIATLLLTQWATGPIVGETEHQTVVNAIGRDERKRALKIYLEELERLAFQES